MLSKQQVADAYKKKASMGSDETVYVAVVYTINYDNADLYLVTDGSGTYKTYNGEDFIKLRNGEMSEIRHSWLEWNKFQ